MSAEKFAELKFEAPGPGTWKLDPVHHPRPVTKYWTEMHPDPFHLGVGDFTEYYGMLLDHLECQYVNGFSYMCPIPVADEKVPERLARAEQVFENKLWRKQVDEWDNEIKPAAIAKHREILSVDPDDLSDEELIDYLNRCRDHHSAMIAQHMRYTAAAVVPTGDFLAHLSDWTEYTHSELLDLLRGTAPVSAGASAEFELLTNLLASDQDARKKLFETDDPASAIKAIRSSGGKLGEAMNAYLNLVGYRLLDGFDIAEPCAIELPDVLVRSILTAVEGRPSETPDLEQKIAAVRAKVPEAHKDEFDELLGEARHTYRLRDERGVFSDIWASGIMRRAALAAGDRLAKKGRIHEPDHFVYAGIDEMAALLSGDDVPSADELAARAEYRATHRANMAPMTLGPPPPPPPDLSQLPPYGARMMRATDIALGAIFDDSEAEHEVNMLRGLAASKGVYEGPARRVSGPADFDRIKSGDILVTESTTEAFNILLPLLGAIVTDSGGLLSHSAIVAREYGIPGVVGTREATARISDGAKLRVDGNQGEVTVVSS